LPQSYNFFLFFSQIFKFFVNFAAAKQNFGIVV